MEGKIFKYYSELHKDWRIQYSDEKMSMRFRFNTEQDADEGAAVVNALVKQANEELRESYETRNF